MCEDEHSDNFRGPSVVSNMYCKSEFGGCSLQLARNRFKLGMAIDTIGYVIGIQTEGEHESENTDVCTASSINAPCPISPLLSFTTRFKLNNQVFILCKLR